MNFLDWLEKTRMKSESSRRRIAYVWTFVTVAIVMVVWLIQSKF